MDNKPTPRGYGKTLGSSGTNLTAGHISAEDYNSQLVGYNLIRNVEIMRRSDGTIRQILQMIKQPLLGLSWDLEAPSDDPEDVRKTDAIRHDMFHRKVNWQQFMNEQLTAIDFGYSVGEKTYELFTYEGRTMVGTKEIGYRKQTTIYSWETKDKQPGIQQQLPNDSKIINIPREKLIVYTHNKEGDNHEGISQLRYAYKDWYTKDKLQLIMAVGAEKVAIPTPVLKTPENTNDDDPNLIKAIELLRQLRSNEEAYLKVPHGWEVETLAMQNQGIKDLLPFIQYLDRQIQTSILVPFMSLGSSDASGSRSAGEVQYKPYILQEEAIANEFAYSIQEQWVKQLCDLNFSDMPNGYPKLVHSKVQDDDVTQLSGALKSMADAKLLTANFELEQHLRKIAHLPELTEDDRNAYEEQQKQNQELARKALEAPAVPPKPEPKKDETIKKKADDALERIRRANRDAVRAMDIFTPKGR